MQRGTIFFFVGGGDDIVGLNYIWLCSTDTFYVPFEKENVGLTTYINILSNYINETRAIVLFECKFNRRHMGHIALLRQQFKLINT